MNLDRARSQDNRYLLHLHLVAAIGALLLCASGFLSLQGCKHSNNFEKTKIEELSSPGAQEIYDDLLKATSLGRRLLYADNLIGRIVWNEAQFMESLLNMYEVTKDRRYLEIFVEHADHVLQMRDDRAGRPDYAGRLRPGWQAGAYYTLGVPVIIPDEQGRPTLEIQGIRQAGNDHTVVEITQENGGRFTLRVRNNFRRSEPLEVKFEGLTLETVEEVVNANLSPQSWVRVRVVGSAPPVSGVWPLKETYRMVIHELHTPIIGVPFLRFADLVFRSPELAIYQPKAEKYVQAFEESFRDYANSWREDAEGGYLVFEPGGKFWASGLPVPYNGLSANGRFLLWLYRATGNTNYLERATAVARKVRAGTTFLPDGTMTMPYWIKDSLPYTGWKNRESDPVNGLYSRSDPDRATEDVSHFSLTLRFMVEAWQMSVVFRDDDLKAVARTFVKRLWKPSNAKVHELCNPDWRKGFFLAHNLDGNGRAYDYAIATFALLSRWEPTMLARALEVYEARYKDADCIDTDYLYGEVMLGWSVLALKGMPPVIGFREKPLYPFTLRASAEEYVQSSRLVSLDEHGIPVTDYGALHGGAGRRYNPTFIANYALALYRDYLVKGDPALLQAFQKQVQWFLDHRTQREYRGFEFWVWEFDFDNPLFGAKAPWVSALSQGRVLCVFLAAYDLINDPEYLRAAEYAFRSFVVPVSAGGVTTFEGNIAWYEEVADEEAPSAKILNGHIAAVQGLWTFWKWTGRQDVKHYLDLGIAAVKRDLDRYDAGFLSYYSQYPENPRLFAPARDYNTLHVHQLLWLYSITEEPLFLYYALRFARYDEPGWSITTAGSTDPKGHGPENLYLEMYSRYWSHNEFPTWVQIDLGSVQEVTGVTLLGYLERAAPKDYKIFSSITGEKWDLVRERWNNTQQYPTETFDEIVSARFIKIEILSDNGNKNVALTGVGIHRVDGPPTAVSDWESFGSKHRRPTLAFTTGWPIPTKGWWVADLVKSESKAAVLRFSGAKVVKLSLWGSDDLQFFTPLPLQEVSCEEVCYLLENIPYRYIKVQIEEGSERGFLYFQWGNGTK